MGWRPTGNSLSWVGPAIGRLMLAKRPPLGLFQAQTFGGVYSVVSAMVDLLALTEMWETRWVKRGVKPDWTKFFRQSPVGPGGRPIPRSAQQHRPGAVG